MSDVHGGERLDRFEPPPGTVLIADAGYPHPREMCAALEQGGAPPVRMFSLLVRALRAALSGPSAWPNLDLRDPRLARHIADTPRRRTRQTGVVSVQFISLSAC